MSLRFHHRAELGQLGGNSPGADTTRRRIKKTLSKELRSHRGWRGNRGSPQNYKTNSSKCLRIRPLSMNRLSLSVHKLRSMSYHRPGGATVSTAWEDRPRHRRHSHLVALRASV